MEKSMEPVFVAESGELRELEKSLKTVSGAELAPDPWARREIACKGN